MKPNFRVAISGEYTTNGMLFRLYYPKARVIYMNFLDIEDAVKSGMVDAGVLIHESILDFDETLEVEKEMWDIWLELVEEELPLPLGGMALRRSIPLNRAIEIEEILTEGVRVANSRKRELCQELESRDLVRISDRMLDRYLNMYASEDSIELSPLQIRALNRLYRVIYNIDVDIEDYLIPRGYKEIRYK